MPGVKKKKTVDKKGGHGLVSVLLFGVGQICAKVVMNQRRGLLHHDILAIPCTHARRLYAGSACLHSVLLFPSIYRELFIGVGVRRLDRW